MKKIILLLLLVLCFADVQAQGRRDRHKVERDSLPYMKYPELPAFNVRMMDSVTIFNTFNIPSGQPTVIFFFEPTCKHCHDVTTELLAHMDSLKNIQFYFITPSNDFPAIRQFAKEFKMDNYTNIKLVGRDFEFFFIDYYAVNSFPDLALYDDQKKIIHLFEGRATVKDLYDYTHKK